MHAAYRYLATAVLAWPLWCAAARAADEPQPADPPEASPVEQLSVEQEALADKYERLEKLLDDMARIEAVTDPRRAALLMQALKQSKERLTAVKLDSVSRLLGQEQLNRALENQRDAQGDIKALLELLLSENRSDRLNREQQRIREYLKELERIIRLEKGVQGRTEGGADAAKLARDQAQIADRTGELADRIRQSEEGGEAGEGQQASSEAEGAKPSEAPEPGDADGKEKPGTEKQPSDSQADKPPAEKSASESGEGQKPPAGEGQEPSPGDGQKPDAGTPQEGQPQQGQPQQGQPQEGQPQQGQPQQGQPQEGQPQQGQQGDEQQPETPEDENPARKRIEAAQQRMQDAQQRLEEAKRDEALEEQERARQELEAAKAELERILRQLREEEVERVLALLEGRFRKMLEIQLRIYEDTKQLSRVPADQHDQRVPIPAGKLATEERKLVVEADKALNLLLEEGSSVAFPETVSQMRDDMQQVSQRLDAASVGTVTQGIEEDVIAALEEMIAALQKAQKDMEQQQQDPQQTPPGDPQQQPLVDALAEIRMIRALQMRVNTRTQRYAKLLDKVDDPVGQATDQGLVEAISQLAERQKRIYKITRDLVLGKNK